MITSFNFASKQLELTLGTTIQNVLANISNLQGAQRTIVQISVINCLAKIYFLLFNLFGGNQI
jgi:hypothetical protein